MNLEDVNLQILKDQDIYKEGGEDSCTSFNTDNMGEPNTEFVEDI